MHVAIIMDGNRRWARTHALPAAEGYRRGVIALRDAVSAALASGVDRLTVFGFSTENWTRDAAEVGIIMQLCAASARSELFGLRSQGVRVEVIGDIDGLALPVRAALRDLMRATQGNRRLTLALALNYSGREEIVRAARSLAGDVASGRLVAADIDERSIRARMYAPAAPDPDLLIRTGGEERVSNFMLYHLAYTELLMLPVLWPDFTECHFLTAVERFGERQRRFGA